MPTVVQIALNRIKAKQAATTVATVATPVAPTTASKADIIAMFEEPQAVRTPEKRTKPEYTKRGEQPTKRYQPSKGRKRSEKDRAERKARFKEILWDGQGVKPSANPADPDVPDDQDNASDSPYNATAAPTSGEDTLAAQALKTATALEAQKKLGFKGSYIDLPRRDNFQDVPEALPLTEAEARAQHLPMRQSWGNWEYRESVTSKGYTVCRVAGTQAPPAAKSYRVSDLYLKFGTAGAAGDSESSRPPCVGGCICYGRDCGRR
jgi:hypothetical protein